MSVYSSKEIAEQVGIAESTVRLWTKQFNVRYKKSSGRVSFSSDSFDVFKTIKQLKENLNGMETIRKRICPDMRPHDKDMSGTEQSMRMEISVIQEHINASLIQTIKEHNELAEKYARATYTIGQLEERIKGLEVKIKSIEAPKSSWWFKLFGKKI